MKTKKHKKKRKVSIAQILRRKDVKAHLVAAENRGYHRGFTACKNTTLEVPQTFRDRGYNG